MSFNQKRLYIIFGYTIIQYVPCPGCTQCRCCVFSCASKSARSNGSGCSITDATHRSLGSGRVAESQLALPPFAVSCLSVVRFNHPIRWQKGFLCSLPAGVWWLEHFKWVALGAVAVKLPRIALKASAAMHCRIIDINALMSIAVAGAFPPPDSPSTRLCGLVCSPYC